MNTEETKILIFWILKLRRGETRTRRFYFFEVKFLSSKETFAE